MNNVLKKISHFPIFTAWTIFLLFAFLLVRTDLFAMPPAGTKINNKALTNYIDKATGLYSAVSSNPVTIELQSIEALKLASSQDITASLGSNVVLSHRLTNTGNLTTKYIVNLSKKSGDIVLLSKFLDLNSNGVAEISDPLISDGDIVELKPGESVDIVITGIIPDYASLSSASVIVLTATSTVQSVAAVNMDTITATDVATLKTWKSASTLSPNNNDNVEFTLTTTNKGNKTAAGLPVIVDNNPLNLVVIRDSIPANTTFVKFEKGNGGIYLYHINGDPLHTYTTSPPSSPEKVNAVAVGFQSVSPNVSLSVSFTVNIHENARGEITNSGHVYFSDGGGREAVSDSNIVVLKINKASPAQITSFQNKEFKSTSNVVSLSPDTSCKELYIEIDAAECNKSSSEIDKQPVTISSMLTGDMETYIAEETSPNAGIFRINTAAPRLPNIEWVPTRNAAFHPATADNGYIETTRNDTLTAKLKGCGTDEIAVNILVDPFGTIFDSRTNVPVAGAVVTLIDVAGTGNGGNAGGPAIVFDTTGAPAPSTVTTGADGFYQFPLVAASIYRLAVTPPNGYSFPSSVPAGLLPPGRTIDISGSYGGNFPVNAQTGAVKIDMPLDPGPASGFFIEKSSLHKTAEVGDFIDYSIRIKNNTGKLLGVISVTDNLPAGFAYQHGTARLDSSQVADPAGGAGPALVFTVPAGLADGATTTLSYRVKIGPGALQGNGTNRAQASDSFGTVSNATAWKIKVTGGVFSDKAYITGRVFMDCNKNLLLDKDEYGIPGVWLYLEDGTFAVTDGSGKYSFYGISPRTHVLKLDNTTMPEGFSLIALSNRNSGSLTTRFIDLKKSEMHRADFAEGSCSEDVVSEVKRRIQEVVFAEESNKGLSSTLILETVNRSVSETRLQSASGVIGSDSPHMPVYKPVLQANQEADSWNILPSGPGLNSSFLDFEDRLSKFDNTLDFIDLKDGDILPYRQVNIVVKGTLGGIFSLNVNGEDISESLVGTKAMLSNTQIEAWEYVGVSLRPGVNELKVTNTDQFSNQRGSRSIKVTAPDNLGKIVVTLPAHEMPADGKSPVNVKVFLTDDSGVPVTVRTHMTLETSLGQWQANDLNDTEPGVQVFVEGGSAEFALIAPHEPGDAVIRVSSGILKSEAGIFFSPPLRPMIAAGLMEGVINLRKLDPKALVPDRTQDGFDQELKELTFKGDNGKLQGGGRTAFFLKGKVKGEYLITAAFDSDKDTKERLFRDIQPDEYYPVYGDSSVKGFDAQSTGRLYVRVDKNRSYMLYGDFTTPPAGAVKKLGAYNRSFNGIKGHYEQKNVSLTAFASEDTSRQVTEELPAQGVSGPYFISNTNLIINSEKIEIITRDRNQPAIVLKTVPQSRFNDYEIEPFSGRILFRAPVPSMDANLNPNFIRINYEVEQDGEKFWVAGTDAQVKLNENIEIGGSYVRDNNPQDKADFKSAGATVKLNEKLFVITEWAQTFRESSGRGDGQRAEVRYEGEKLQANMHAEKTDTDFINPSSGISSGRLEAGTKLNYKFTQKNIVRLELFHSKDVLNKGRRDGFLVNTEHVLGRYLKAEAGMRYSRETATASQAMSIGITPFDYASLRAKLGAQMPGLPQLGVSAEYEHSLKSGDRKAAAVGGEYLFATFGRVYARHEFISGISSPFALNGGQQRNVSLIGIDTKYMKDGNLFSEYRIRDSISGRDAETAIGLRNAWSIRKGLRLNTSMERIQSLGAAVQNNSTALTGAVEYTANPRWKGTTRLEYRTAASGNSVLNNIGLAYKLNDDFTFLGKTILNITDNKNGVADKSQERLQAGLAYRPADSNLFYALTKYEYKHEKNSSLSGLAGDRNVHILSTHMNYQPKRPLTLGSVYAGKLLSEYGSGIRSTSSSHMLNLRAIYDITEKLDASIMSGALFSNSLRSCQYGLGGEIGYMVIKDLWLSGGYNVFGFKDKDLAATEYTNPGAYIRLRFKFDEEFLGLRNLSAKSESKDKKVEEKEK